MRLIRTEYNKYMQLTALRAARKTEQVLRSYKLNLIVIAYKEYKSD